jgi:hypothetical protein
MTPGDHPRDPLRGRALDTQSPWAHDLVVPWALLHESSLQLGKRGTVTAAGRAGDVFRWGAIQSASIRTSGKGNVWRGAYTGEVPMRGGGWWPLAP